MSILINRQIVKLNSNLMYSNLPRFHACADSDTTLQRGPGLGTRLGGGRKGKGGNVGEREGRGKEGGEEERCERGKEREGRKEARGER